MHRHARTTGDRASALWARGAGGGDVGRRHGWTAIAVAVVALALPLAAAAADGTRVPAKRTAPAFVSEGLLQAATAHRSGTFHVIVVGQPGVDAGAIKNDLMKDARGNQFGHVRREFEYALDGLAADVTGAQLLQLAERRGIRSITPDTPVKSLGVPPSFWREAIDLAGVASSPSRKRVAIAVVDTGVDKDRKADFGGRVVQSHEFASLAPTRGSGTDYSGHGTLVAGIAAGSSAAHPGAAPQADIVSLRVMNEEGRAITSDVIAAADWIYENRRSLNIRVVNFSLHSPYPNYSLQDPLNEAVRRLWLTGTVVVAASGNAGAGRMLHAPASDPFVITVGASDTSGTRDAGDDVNAPWSSYGYTAEGFAKPELAAPGRYLVGPVSVDSLVGVFPDRVVAPGYMWMSGTSFAAPVVAGVAARIVALHPTWTPDQVKGALMLGARPLAGAAPMSAGVGQIDAAAAAAATDPPNPNASLDRFVAHDARVPGRRVFDVGAWSLAAWSSAAWSSAAWSSAAWADAAWSSAAWADAAWSSAAWADAAWADAAWADAAWSSASWAEAAWADALVGAEGG